MKNNMITRQETADILTKALKEKLIGTAYPYNKRRIIKDVIVTYDLNTHYSDNGEPCINELIIHVLTTTKLSKKGYWQRYYIAD